MRPQGLPKMGYWLFLPPLAFIRIQAPLLDCPASHLPRNQYAPCWLFFLTTVGILHLKGDNTA